MSNPFCGIVMPISPMGDCSAQHWLDVRAVLEEAIADASYTPRLVSLGDEVSIIHERIVNNLYQDEIVVCDVSHKNANVMFELGLRLAFDKPVIIVKDSETDYIFDTGPVEHLEYPRSLRFGQIKDFKVNLTKKILATVKAKRDNPDFSPFLGSFGPLKSVKLETKEVSSQEVILDYLSRISSRLDVIESRSPGLSSVAQRIKPKVTRLAIPMTKVLTSREAQKIGNTLMKVPGVQEVEFLSSSDQTTVNVDVNKDLLEYDKNIPFILKSMAEDTLLTVTTGEG